MLQPPPPKFKKHVYTFSFKIAASEEEVWNWLNDTKTFTDTQVYPYMVEFYSPENNQHNVGFKEGVLTNHYGPLINFAGVLTEVSSNYRDLQYYYGSYAFNFKWVRPYRLEFKTEVNDALECIIEGTISCYVKPWIFKYWNSLQKIFWKRFEKWAKKSIEKN